MTRNVSKKHLNNVKNYLSPSAFDAYLRGEFTKNSMSLGAFYAYKKGLLPASKITKKVPSYLITKYCPIRETHGTSLHSHPTNFYEKDYVLGTFGLLENIQGNPDAIADLKNYRYETDSNGVKLKKKRKFENNLLVETSYYYKDILCRLDGPAKIGYFKNGKVRYEEYYLNGQLHREDGPAEIVYYENGSVFNEKYFQDDKLHRLDGPAATYYDKEGKIKEVAFFIDNVRYSLDNYCAKISRSTALKVKITYA